MCGIAGKLAPSAGVTEQVIHRMCEVIEHRGPDSRGVFCGDQGVGLGIQRLRVIDLDTGDQPIFNEDRSVVVVLNGEIYNYRELREELRRRGHRFSSDTDTEVIVHLYEEHGDRCVDHLRGMFAFALWDRRRRRLLVARDRVGKKPLFYSQAGEKLWFGSEAKSILQDPEVPREMDAGAIDSYLHYQYVPDPQSAFAALRKLPPGHLLTWEDGKTSIERYWKLSFAQKDSYSSEEEMHERLREELLEATQLRLRSDVALGAFLSGGLDSSAVVAAMARLSSVPVKTFSIGFDVASFDETAYAREVAELFETDHHEFVLDPNSMEILPDLVWHYGEPFADQAAVPTWYLSKMTREHVTVALNGDGGDEVFAGYWRYLSNLRLRRMSWVPRPLASVGADALERFVSPRSQTVPARAARLARKLSMTAWERDAKLTSQFNEQEREELYTPEFRAEIGPEHESTEATRRAWEQSDATAFVERLLDVDVNSYLPGALLVKVDIASMAHSLEARSPLLDQKLMEFAARLPASVKLERSVTKRVFKDAMRAWLPNRIIDREKQGFGVPVADWLRGPLRELPRDVLLDHRSRERGIFRPETIESLIDLHIDGTEDNSRKIWTLLQLELWQRTFIDPAEPRKLTI